MITFLYLMQRYAFLPKMQTVPEIFFRTERPGKETEVFRRTGRRASRSSFVGEGIASVRRKRAGGGVGLLFPENEIDGQNQERESEGVVPAERFGFEKGQCEHGEDAQ